MVYTKVLKRFKGSYFQHYLSIFYPREAGNCVSTHCKCINLTFLPLCYQTDSTLEDDAVVPELEGSPRPVVSSSLQLVLQSPSPSLESVNSADTLQVNPRYKTCSLCVLSKTLGIFSLTYFFLFWITNIFCGHKVEPPCMNNER